MKRQIGVVHEACFSLLPQTRSQTSSPLSVSLCMISTSHDVRWRAFHNTRRDLFLDDKVSIKSPFEKQETERERCSKDQAPTDFVEKN